ncbi:28S ribosomal protein S18c, mitochondrial [Chamberlinius hualienensis]
MATLLRMLVARHCRSGITLGTLRSNCHTSTNTDSFVANIPKQESDELDEIIKARSQDMPEPTIENPYKPEPCLCILCEFNVRVDYKNTKLLSQFISPHTGQLYDKNITGLCEKQQEKIKRLLQISRASGFMPFVYKDLAYLKDPNICSKKRRR